MLARKTAARPKPNRNGRREKLKQTRSEGPNAQNRKKGVLTKPALLKAEIAAARATPKATGNPKSNRRAADPGSGELTAGQISAAKTNAIGNSST